MMNNIDEDCVVADALVRTFIVLIQYEKYRLAQILYKLIKIEFKEDDDFLDDYISFIKAKFPHFEFMDIAEQLKIINEALKNYKRLNRVIPLSFDSKTQKL